MSDAFAKAAKARGEIDPVSRNVANKAESKKSLCLDTTAVRCALRAAGFSPIPVIGSHQ